MITVTTSRPPAALAVDLAEVKTFLRIDGSADDTSVSMMIKAATLTVESYLRRSLITQERTLYSTGTSKVYLPYPPILSITSVHLVSEDGTETELTDYDKSINIERPFINVYSYDSEVKVVYETGYGASETDIPAPIRQEIMNIILPMYERRGTDYQKEIVNALQRLSFYRIKRVE